MKRSIDKLVPRYTRENDPNKMTEEEFDALCKFIERGGFLQSVTVEPKNAKGEYIIIDGHHRYWAAKQLGLEELEITIYKGEDPPEAIGLGLNHIRGNPDAQAVKSTLVDLTQVKELELHDVAILTGYSEVEITDLVSTPPSPEPDDDGATGGDDERDEALPKPFLLEIQFSDRETYKKVKRKLKKAAGKGGDLALGLLNVLGETQ